MIIALAAIVVAGTVAYQFDGRPHARAAPDAAELDCGSCDARKKDLSRLRQALGTTEGEVK